MAASDNRRKPALGNPRWGQDPFLAISPEFADALNSLVNTSVSTTPQQ